jgi:orotate phosphoribosyltransferase
MNRQPTDWVWEYKQQGALWMHDGNEKRPHALLASGQHSDGFFNSRLVIEHEALLRDAAADLLELFVQSGGNLDLVEGVIGPQTGATKMAEFLSEEVQAKTGRPCFWMSPAKAEGPDSQKIMVFSPAELERLAQAPSVLPCEDVTTTGESVELAIQAAIKGGGKILPHILALVNRSGYKVLNRRRIMALIDRAMPMWLPDKCPLCLRGSQAVRPKDNWLALTAEY